MEWEFSQKNLKNKRLDKALTVAAELFLQQGIANVKMTDIADKSGIGVATLYRYFGTKTGIAIETMTYLWNDLHKKFSHIFDSDIFKNQKGIKQISDLMKMNLVLFIAHKNFVKLLGDFDRLIVQENIPKEELKEYEKSIIDFYPIVEKAYITGLKDGSVRKIENFKLFYLTFTHSLIELSKKLLQGELLPSDDFSKGEDELNMIIETAVYYLKEEK